VKCIANFCIPKAAFYAATERTSLQKRKTQQTQNHLQYQIPASRSEGTQHSVFYTTIALTALFRHDSSFSTRHIEGREKLGGERIRILHQYRPFVSRKNTPFHCLLFVHRQTCFTLQDLKFIHIKFLKSNFYLQLNTLRLHSEEKQVNAI
jgi:hypothetical protein